MKIAICASKKWFKLSDQLLKDHRILNIEKKCDLTLEALGQFEPDLVFFPHWSSIVGSKIFKKYTCILFHTAPLPFGRGGSPIQNLIKLGYKKSPVCAVAMSDCIDFRPIYDQLDINLDGSLSEILERLNNTINTLILRLIDQLPEPIAQTGNIKIFKRLGGKDNEISYDATLEKFYDFVRMLDDPSYPNAYLNLENVNIEFSKINRKCGELFCQVRIPPKDLKK